MDTILMCKNTPVYNLDTEQVYNFDLLPGFMMKNPCKDTFDIWSRSRYSLNTNSMARQLKGVTFGQGKRREINRRTRAFSLSDCYWLRQADDKSLFEQLSPYHTPFWKGQSDYMGGSIPTLYVNGALSKAWLDSVKLYKDSPHPNVEVECFRMCSLCGISVSKIELSSDGKGVIVYNFTNTDVMLEEADKSGKIDPDDFDEYTIEKLMGIDGIRMIIIDAITGNGDRHAGNFGYLRNAYTGEYMGMAPVYDFDHVLDSTQEWDRLTSDMLEVVLKNQEYKQELYRIAKTVAENTSNNVFRLRSQAILKKLQS